MQKHPAGRVTVEGKRFLTPFSRFMNGKGGLQMDSLDRLAELLGLDVVVRGKHGRKEVYR